MRPFFNYKECQIMNALHVFAVVLVGYLIGSIPFAVLVSRVYGVNILEHGSRNPGASNVKRVLGRKAGNLCFIFDALKGFVSAGWPLMPLIDSAYPCRLAILGLFSSILGHSFSVFLRFRGGKGVATTMGGLLALTPLVLGLSLVVWLIAFYGFRYVSVASICFGISLPLAGWLLHSNGEEIIFTAVIATLIVVRHRTNLRRLLAGTEHRFVKGSGS